MGIVANCDCSLLKNKVYDIDSFPYEWFYRLPLLKHAKGETKSSKRKDYIDAISTLDIETTRIDDIKQSIMYIWQFCINGICCVGRTLPELKRFFDKLSLYSDDKTKLLCFVHNLSFEFHHIRDLIHFEGVFSVDKRRPIKALYKGIEFRCSYVLTNMSLDAFLKKMKVSALKTTLDYSKKRYPWSRLNASETEYCLHDVIGLYEAIKQQLKIESDTLYTLPLTSTGYTRRDVRKAYFNQSRKADFQEAIPSFEVFEELREAFRGGNTHANRWVSGVLIDSEDYGLIHSYDRASSYPDVLLKQLYPGKFTPYAGDVWEAINRGYAVLTRVKIYNLKMRDRYDGCPYIPISKTRNISVNHIEDNGRLLEADSFTMTITDIDLKIIFDQYECDFEFFDTQIAEYKPLPAEIKKVVLKYFYGKTQLKGDESKEFEYGKFKNRFNAIYGLFVQSPAKLLIDYVEDSEEDIFQYSKEKTLCEIYEENKKKIFLQYAVGVWVTCWARKELQDIINLVQSTPGALFLYTDTDSVKFTGEVDFTAYNQKHIEMSQKCGAVAKDINGKVHYIGVLEKEKDMLQFITHGAKKYCCVTIDGKLHLTCAGVNKKKGAEELNTIKWFKEGFIFGESAGLEARYNDRPNIKFYNIGAHRVRIYSNIYLSDSTYTLTKSPKYKDLLAKLEYIGV